MPNIAIFDSDHFSLASLTTSINTLPVTQGFLGSLGIFAEEGINTLAAAFEENNGELRIIPSQVRGAQNRVVGEVAPSVRYIPVPHFPYDGAVKADDIYTLRSFGGETELRTVARLVNNKLANMRASHEATHEFGRIGAIKGVVVDSSGVVLANLFTEFGQAETNVNFNMAAGVDPQAAIMEVQAAIGEALNGVPYRYILGLCGTDFYRNLVLNDVVIEAKKEADGNFQSESRQEGIVYGGVTFRPYRGSLGGDPFIPVDQCRFIPVGVPNLFKEIFAPANFAETVGTIGRRIYVKSARQKFDVGVELHSQSNVLPVCTRPKVLVKGTDVTV